MKAEQPLESKARPQSHDDSIDNFSINGFSSGSRHQFFEGGDRGQILDVLPLLQMEGKNCVVIEGDAGMGKTILAHQIFAQAQNSGFATIRVDAHELSSTNEQELYKLFGQYFKMSNDEIATLDSGEALAHRAVAHVHSQIVMIVDEAQALSAEAIAILVEFLKATPRSKAQVVFLALPSSPELMADFELQDYLSEHGHQITLRPFNSRETSDYVRFLLIASEREAVKLSPQLQGKIYQVSEGVPSRIIQGLEDALHEQAQAPVEEEGKQRREIVPKWHLVSLSLVAAGVIALIIFGNPDKPTDTRFSDTVRSVPEDIADYDAPQMNFEDQQAQKSYNAEYGQSGYSQNAYQGSMQSADDSLVEQPRFRGVEENSSLSQGSSDSMNSQPESYSREAQNRNSEVSEYASKPYTSAPRESASASAPVERTPVQPKEQPEPTKVSMADQLAKLKAEKVSAPAPSASSSSGDSSWIKGMPSSHYTLQLLGGANKGAIEKFVNENGNYRKMGYFETRLQGQPWYVVVYGDFPSRAQAIAAADQLPSNLTTSKPWPRSASDIHSNMH